MEFIIFAKDFHSNEVDVIYYTNEKEQISQIMFVTNFCSTKDTMLGAICWPCDGTYALCTQGHSPL